MSETQPMQTHDIPQPPPLPATVPTAKLATQNTPPPPPPLPPTALPFPAAKLPPVEDNPASTAAVVRAWMKTNSLEIYADELIRQGYDDLAVLKTMKKDDLIEAANHAKMLPGHRAKFLFALQRGPSSSSEECKPETDTSDNPALTELVAVRAPLFSSSKIFTLRSGYVCNVCSKSIKKMETMYTCRTRQYHMCSACYKKAMAKKNTKDSSYVAMIVDRSGSMRSMGAEVKNGFNTFLKEQKSQTGTCYATVVRFDSKIEILQHGVSIHDVKYADRNTFKPRGSTALVDAIGKTIKMMENKIESFRNKPSRIMVMILTDGHDNKSHKFTSKQIKAKIKALEETGDWEFVFVGANQDAIKVGQRYGMKSKNCLSFDADRHHGKQTWDVLAENAVTYRACASKSAYGGFSLSQRRKCK